MIIFAVDKGVFPISDLMQFSKNTGAKVIVKNTCVIDNGEVIIDDTKSEFKQIH
jgi:hypothetical protein